MRQKKSITATLNLDCTTLLDMQIKILDAIQVHGGSAYCSPDYDNYGDFEINYERDETDEEMEIRIEKEQELEDKKLSKKRKQYEKLKEELGL
tara:strand:+ start:709 stop:987 length:279 start_codon:yes stop_codon:yes gene_type:complete